MRERAGISVSFSRMTVLAGLSLALLVGVALWQGIGLWIKGNTEITAKNDTPPTTSPINWQRGVAEGDPDDIANIRGNVLGTLIGTYALLKDEGSYTAAQGTALAHTVGEDMKATVTYKTYTKKDISVDPSISQERMLTYRADMRDALEPLLQNESYELELLARYVNTKDQTYLDDLARVTENYSSAIANAEQIIVPADAITQHLAVLNALSEFRAVLENLGRFADDPFAVAALTRTFGDAEENMHLSFNTLADYFRTYTST